MRTLIALIAGAVVLIGLLLLFRTLGDYVGIEIYVEYEEPRVIEHRLYTEESDGSCTGFGFVTILISGMLAWRAALSVETGSLRGNASVREQAVFTAWLAGCLRYMTLCIVTELASRQVPKSLARGVLAIGDFPSLLLTAWILRGWYRRRVEKMSAPDGPTS